MLRTVYALKLSDKKVGGLDKNEWNINGIIQELDICWNYSILFTCSSIESQPLNKFAINSVISPLGQSVLMLPHLRGFMEKYWETLL